MPMASRPTYTVQLPMPLLPFRQRARLWVSWKPGCRLTASGSTHKKSNLSALALGSACEARPIRHCHWLPPFDLFHVVRYFRVTLDQELTFAPHIHRLCRVSYYLLRQLRTVVRSLTSDATATLIHAFITCNPNRLLQLTLRWPPSWVVTVPRPGPAHYRTPLCTHPQIWPCFQLYAGCAPLAPIPTEDFVSYNFFSLAVPPGPRSGLS